MLVARLAAAEQAVSFGAVADVQFARKDTTGARHYGSSITWLEPIIATFNTQAPAFVVQLGDMVDGYPADPAASLADLEQVLTAFSSLRPRRVDVLGNHCATVPLTALRARYQGPYESATRFYGGFDLDGRADFRCLILDGQEAGYGLVGSNQLAWLRASLAAAQARGQRCLLFCHFPLIKEAAAGARLKNADAVLAALDESPAPCLWLAGHDHRGGYAVRRGVHHLTLRGLVETPPAGAAAIITVETEHLRVTGLAGETSRILTLAPRPTPLTAP